MPVDVNSDYTHGLLSEEAIAILETGSALVAVDRRRLEAARGRTRATLMSYLGGKAEDEGVRVYGGILSI